MKNTNLMEMYQKELIEIREASNNTLRSYMRACSDYATWLSDRGKKLTESTRDDIVAYKMTLDGARASVALKIHALKSLFEFAEDNDIIVKSPVPRKLVVKVKSQTPTQVPTASQFIGMRNKIGTMQLHPGGVSRFTRQVILETLAGTGMRISALLTVRPNHLQLGDVPHIKVVAGEMACKGHEAASIPMTDYAALLLKQYVNRPDVVDGKPIFNVSASWVRNLLTQLSPESMKLSPHSLRHFYVCMCYYKNFDQGRNDIVWVRDAAGHANISVTNRYLRLARTICTNDGDWEAWQTGKRIQKISA